MTISYYDATFISTDLLPCRQTGLLVMGPENSQYYTTVKNTLLRNKVPLMVLTHENFSQHIPHVKLAEGDEAVVDITAGVLYADRALKTAQVLHRYCSYSMRYVSSRSCCYDSRPFLLCTQVNYSSYTICTVTCWHFTGNNHILLEQAVRDMKMIYNIFCS